MLFFEIWKPMFIFHSVKTFSPATKNSPPYRQASIATFREGQTSIEWNPISFFRTYQGVYSCSGNNDRGRSNPRNTIRLLIFPPFFSDTWWTGVRRKNKHTHCEQVCWRKKRETIEKKRINVSPSFSAFRQLNMRHSMAHLYVCECCLRLSVPTQLPCNCNCNQLWPTHTHTDTHSYQDSAASGWISLHASFI